MEGTTLVVSEVETADLPTHKLWMDVLQCKDQLHNAQGPLKLNVNEVEPLCAYIFSISLCRLEIRRLNVVPNSSEMRVGGGGGGLGGKGGRG